MLAQKQISPVTSPPSAMASGLQFALTLPPSEREHVAYSCIYESCSADYDVVTLPPPKGDGDGYNYFKACYAKPTFPGVPVIRPSGKVTHQAALFDALVTPVPGESRVARCHDGSASGDGPPCPHYAPPSHDTPSPDASPSPGTCTPSPEAAPSYDEARLEEIDRYLRRTRRALLKLRCPFVGARNLLADVPSLCSKRQARHYLRSRISALEALRKDVKGVMH